MAHYRHLPVWKAAMDLAVHLAHFCGSGGSRETFAPSGAPTRQDSVIRRSGGSREPSNPASHPNGIPMWVIACFFNQTRPDRVAHHITPGGTQIFFAPQSMVVKACLPERPAGCTKPAVDDLGGMGLEMPNQRRQATLRQLHQPMHMVGHQDVSQCLASAPVLASAQLGNGESGESKVGEHGGSIMSDRGDQIHPAGFGIPPPAQGRRMCRHGGHYGSASSRALRRSHTNIAVPLSRSHTNITVPLSRLPALPQKHAAPTKTCRVVAPTLSLPRRSGGSREPLFLFTPIPNL